MERIGEAVRLGADRLAQREDLRQDARRDSMLLLGLATGLSSTEMLAWPERALEPTKAARFAGLLQRRMQGTPVQYLRGSQQFYGREFTVTPDVLIPRPETEDIVEAVLERTADRGSPLCIADVGTGSGVLAITLALELCNTQVTGLDISAEALEVARTNAGRFAATLDDPPGRLRFSQSDLLAAVEEQAFHVIVSNPPYIPTSEAESLHEQVRCFEPHLALFGGEDGLDAIARLVPQAWDRLVAGGLLIMETAGRSSELDVLLGAWSGIEWRRDLRGIERVVVARKPG